MKSNLSLTLLGAALLAAPAVFGQATSGVVGFSSVNVSPGGSVVVPTLVNSSVFQGQATVSSNGLTITPTTAPGWTVGAYAKTSFTVPTPNYPKYYAEIVSGTYEGVLIDISSNTATALTPISAVVPAGIRGTTVQIAIRQHVTLDKVSQGATGLTAYADAVNVFNSNGSTSIRYWDGASWVADDFVTAAGHTVIYPGTGFTIGASGNITFSFMGEVKPTKTQIPLYAAAINVVAPLNPASNTKLYGNSLISALSPYADGFSTFSTDGTMTPTGVYYSDGTNMLNSSYSPLASTASDAIATNRGIILQPTSDTVWTVNSPLAP